FALSRLARRRLPLPVGPLLRRRVAALLGAPPLIARRHGAVLRDGNLWEAANVLARQCFEGTALRAPADPPHAVRGSADQRQYLDALVGRLWHLAYGPPQPVLLPEFAALVRALETVRTALAD